MKQIIHILFAIIILAFGGCKKDDVKVKCFNIVTESVDKRAESITITVKYSYPSTIESVDGFISEDSNMINVQHVHGEISGNTFAIKFSDLQANTSYYCYYEYSNGIDVFRKTDIKTITTNDYSLPIVTTNDVVNLTTTSAICGGEVVDDGDLEITERGICWSTSPSPTIFDNHTSFGIGIGGFTTNLTGLVPYTNYYVRAYASNSLGTSYGEMKAFIAKYPGTIASLFSVSMSKRICFSQGNLQYQASTNTWSFAENQYDCIGQRNTNISSNYSGWIDLFGWGTSGYNHGATCYLPYSTSTTITDYYAYGSYQYSLSNQTGQADWGFNAICNGGNTENNWYTLYRDEWEYVLFTRNTTSNIRFAKAQVNGINGIILVPDNWRASYYRLNSTNSESANYITNIISESTWKENLEVHGAVFLPAAGKRKGTTIDNFNSWGMYWSADINVNHYNKGAYYVHFMEDDLFVYSGYGRCNGCSVRLVSSAE